MPTKINGKGPTEILLETVKENNKIANKQNKLLIGLTIAIAVMTLVMLVQMVYQCN